MPEPVTYYPFTVRLSTDALIDSSEPMYRIWADFAAPSLAAYKNLFDQYGADKGLLSLVDVTVLIIKKQAPELLERLYFDEEAYLLDMHADNPESLQLFATAVSSIYADLHKLEKYVSQVANEEARRPRNTLPEKFNTLLRFIRRITQALIGTRHNPGTSNRLTPFSTDLKEAERQRLLVYVNPAPEKTVCYLLFAEPNTGIVLNADAQTRYMEGVHPDHYVPFDSFEAAEARAKQILSSRCPVEISLLDANKEYLRSIVN